MSLTPDKTRIEYGLTIHEKLIPWGAVWARTVYGAGGKVRFAKGTQYKADRLLSGGTGKVQGVTIHNTEGSANAETYTRATYPNQNMNDVRVHYYVDDREAWQNLKENEVGWHAGDGSGSGNETTLAIEIPMQGKAIADDTAAERNGALLAAILLVRHGLTISQLYPHKQWSGKQCPIYILPHWEAFKGQVAAFLAQITAVNQPVLDTGDFTAISGIAQATPAQMRAYLLSKNPAAGTYADTLPEIYAAEAANEGIRADVAFAQSCIETANFAFGGDVHPLQNNFAGIGATGGGVAGNSFATPAEGVRAQVQHLKAYANTDPLNGACVDPRFQYVTRGAARFVEWLGIPDNPNGKGWAAGKGYGTSILSVMKCIAETAPAPVAPTDPPQGSGKTATLEEVGTLLMNAGITSIIIKI